MGMTGEVPVIVGSILDNTTIQQLKAQFTDNGLYEIVHSGSIASYRKHETRSKKCIIIVKMIFYLCCLQ